MNQLDILLVDPPLTYLEDQITTAGNMRRSPNYENRAFNSGLLSIASYLIGNEYSVNVLNFLHEDDVELKIQKTIEKYETIGVVAVSCNYAYAYESAKNIVNRLKMHYPNCIFVMGGMHVSEIPHYVLEECPCVDFVIRGEGEYAVEKIIDLSCGKCDLSDIGNLVFRKEDLLRYGEEFNLSEYQMWEYVEFLDSKKQLQRISNTIICSRFFEPLIELDNLPNIKYDLYDQYKSYSPYIEESRGCYGECSFCVSSKQQCYRQKSSKRFLEELDYVVSVFGTSQTINFLAANFGVNVQNTIDLCIGIANKPYKIVWDVEFRVDLAWKYYLDYMYQAGCRFFTVGIESCDEEVLKIMKKTKSPFKYLDNVNDFLREMDKYADVFVRINLMFYIGESHLSVLNNLRFLIKNYSSIHSVHYSPVILFPGTWLWNNFEEMSDKYGCSIIQKSQYDSMHIYPLNPSNVFSYEL